MSARKSARRAATLSALIAGGAVSTAATAADVDNIPYLPTAPAVVSTVPPNGDVNPYGVAFVPAGIASGGAINKGDILVSNFNYSDNLQGTGTTIVRIPASGAAPSVFIQTQPGAGLTTTLNVLRAGFVIVGNLPSTDGTSATAQAGSLIIINKNGSLAKQLTDTKYINGPWDSTLWDGGSQAKLAIRLQRLKRYGGAV